jgi:ABC-2 type transport system ATP-binding protein
MDITEEYGAPQAATGTTRSEPVVSVRGLVKRYGSHEAVAGIDLEVRRGEIFAFLGPNGAGKTTTVEILEGFQQRTAGQVSVQGRDPATAGGAGRCSTHGTVEATREVPQAGFPFVVYAIRRAVARRRPFLCPECGAAVQAA